jgi:hypothetical protein
VLTKLGKFILIWVWQQTQERYYNSLSSPQKI